MEPFYLELDMSKRRIVLDIEANGLFDIWRYDGTEVKAGPTEIHCICVRDIDTGWTTSFGNKFCDNKLKDFKPFLKEQVKTLIAHNAIGYDLQVLKDLLDIDFEIFVPDSIDSEIEPDFVVGERIMIVDTLIVSKLLNPDRYFGHSLEEFGYFLGEKKDDFGKTADWSVCTQEMVDYCHQDCLVTEKLFKYLMEKEWGSWNWMPAYNLEKAVAEIVFRQTMVGFDFDQELAKQNVEFLTKELARLEEEVEPKLPPRPLTVSEQNLFTPPKQKYKVEEIYAPKNQFKKNSEITAVFEKFIDKHSGEWIDHKTIKMFGKEFKLPINTEVPMHTNKELAVHMANFITRMKDDFGLEFDLDNLEDLADEPVIDLMTTTLADQEHIKAYLITLGWNPSNWKDKDLTLDSNKQKIPFDKYVKRVERYVEDTLGTPFESFRCDHLEVHPSKLRNYLLTKDTSRPVKVITNPCFTKDVEKNLCDSLIALGEKVSFAKDIVTWLTYRHRKNMILSDNGSGLLTHPRLAVDGRIPTPADTLGAATARFTHKVVANIPRVSSLFGRPMRDMFKPGDGYLQIGCDADALEARIEGHFCFSYPEGDIYAEALTAAKPNDCHTIRANNLGILRDTAKTIKYACLPTDTTEVLTTSGWKFFDELEDADSVITYNTETEVLEQDDILYKHFYKNAEVTEYGNSIKRFESTADHRWYGSWRTGRGSARGVVKGFKQLSEFTQEFNLLQTAEFIGGRSTVTSEEAALIAWLLSDGYWYWSELGKGTSDSNGKRRGVIASITQAHKNYPKHIKDVLDKNLAEYTERIVERDGVSIQTTFHLTAEFARTFLRKVMQGEYQKHDFDWPSWIISLSKDARESFLFNFWLADGNSLNREFKDQPLIFSQNQGNISEGLVIAGTLSGYVVTKHVKVPTVPVKTTKVCEGINMSVKQHMTQQESKVLGKRVVDVFCLTTCNGTFIIRQGNFISITGNCTYGATGKKISRQLGTSLEEGTQLVDAFWEDAKPLALFKEDLLADWKRNKKLYVKGLDGRKLYARSPHSILNTVFQHSGVLCMKRAMVLWDKWVKEEGLKADQLIAYHDESQLRERFEDVKVKTFKTKEEAVEWKQAWEAKTGSLLSNVRKLDNDTYKVYYARSGELAVLSILEGGRYYNLNVELTSAYDVGETWGSCH